MTRPRLPSDSRGQAEMRSHGLIQRGQALVSLLFSAINGGEGSGGRRTDARWVGGVPRFSELVVYFGEERGWALVGGLLAPREKSLVQPAVRWLLGGDHSSPSSLTAFVMIRMSSLSILSLALHEEDSGKRALLDRRQEIDRIYKLIASRGPIQLLRRFNGKSRHQWRVSEGGSSTLKRREMRRRSGRLYSLRPRPFWRAA